MIMELGNKMDIRKISVGPDYKGGAMHYIVGQKILNDTHEVHHIRHVLESNFVHVYIINMKGEIVLWKSFGPTIPISIEYNINF